MSSAQRQAHESHTNALTPAALYFIVIDLGTSRIKAAIFDTSGQQIVQASRACTLVRPRPGWCEQTLDDLLPVVLAAARDCIARAALAPQAYAALALTGQGDGTRLVAADGTPIRPAIIWQDARAIPLIRQWLADGRAQEVQRLTGGRLTGAQQTAQLAWLAQHEPDTLRRARYIFFAKDWLFFHLTGVAATDQSDASFTYCQPPTRQFEPRILDLLRLRAIADQLPPILPPLHSSAPLLGRFAAELGLTAGLPVVLAPFDVVAEMISVGGFRPGVACSVMGTAGIHQVSSPPPYAAADSARLSYTTYIPGEPTLLQFIPNMLAVPNIEFWAALLYPDLPPPAAGYAGDPTLERAVLAVAAGAEGVRYLPFLSPAGERAPHLLPDTHAVFSGLTLHHRREHLLRAVYEGVALAAADSFAYLPAYAAPLQLTGGGARSPALAQILADVLEQPIEVQVNGGGALVGALLFAQVALGYAPDLPTAYARLQFATQRYLPSPQAPLYHDLKQAYAAQVPASRAPVQASS